MSLADALNETRPFLFYAVKIEAPFATLRLLDGEATLYVDSDSPLTPYTGGSDYGVLAGIEAINDGVGAEAPRVMLTLSLNDPDLISSWLAADVQGAPVTIYEGAVDPTTGAVVASPEVAFLGEVDVPSANIGFQTLDIQLDIASYLERFFDVNEGVRLADAWHQTNWPGEKGLDQVTGVERRLPWGTGGGGTAFRGRRSSDQNWWDGSPLSDARRSMYNNLLGLQI